MSATAHGRHEAPLAVFNVASITLNLVTNVYPFPSLSAATGGRMN